MTESQPTDDRARAADRTRPRIGKLLMGIVGVPVLLIGLLLLAPFRFDEGPMWQATVLGVRDGVRDVMVGTPSVLVIGNPSTSSQQAHNLEQHLQSRGFAVRYTGDNTMSAWERKYVAVYWSIVGVVFDPPTG